MEEVQLEQVVNESEQKLFGKWSYNEVNIADPCFKDYIPISTHKSQVYIPHTAGRYQAKSFRKTQCPIVERLVGAMMFNGRNTGKKQMAIRIVKHAFEIVGLMTARNPVDVFVSAIMNGGAREDSTRVGSGGVIRKQAVDVSPMRRTNQGIYLIAQGARLSSMKNNKTIAETLADEIMNCEKGLPASYAIRKKEETEKMAKGNR